MLLLNKLVVFALVGFGPGNTIPGPTLYRIARPRSAVAVDQAGFRLNRLLLQKRQFFGSQGCAHICVLSPYARYCCDEGDVCTTVSGTPVCSFDPIGFSSTSPTSTEWPSSIAEELPTTSSTPSTTVAILTTSATPTSSITVATTTTSASPTFSTSVATSASPTQSSTSQSSSAASQTQASITGSSPTSSGSVTLPSSSSTNPAASSGGDAQSNKIALGVGVPAAVGGIVGAYYAVKSYYRHKSLESPGNMLGK